MRGASGCKQASVTYNWTRKKENPARAVGKPSSGGVFWVDDFEGRDWDLRWDLHAPDGVRNPGAPPNRLCTL